MKQSTEETMLVAETDAETTEIGQSVLSFSKMVLVAASTVVVTLLSIAALQESSIYQSNNDHFYFGLASSSKQRHQEHSSPCDGPLSRVAFADLHDGDEKIVSIQTDHQFTIEPSDTSNSNETWIVHAKLDPTTCSAMVDFNVPGKPSPPPVPLLLTIWTMTTASSGTKLTIEFTDPSETIAPKDRPLNHWVQLL